MVDETATTEAIPKLKAHDADLPKEKTSEVTRAQLSGGSFVTTLSGKFQLFSTLPATYPTYRLILKQPTVNMAFEFTNAPIIANEESIEHDDDIDDEVMEFQPLFPADCLSAHVTPLSVDV